MSHASSPAADNLSTTPPDLARAVFLLACAAFASALSFRLCDPFLPALAGTFHVRIGEAAVVITAFLIVYGVMQLVVGPLGDRFDRYRLIAYATLGCTFGSLGAALAPTLNWLLAARVLTAIFSAGVISVGLAWIADRVPLAERQKILARFLSGQIFGMVSGQVIGGVFVDHIGWRWAFATLAVIYLLIGWLLLRETGRNPAMRKPATAGAAPQRSVIHDMRMVIASPRAWPVMAAVCCEGIAVFPVLAFLPLHLHRGFGISLATASLVLIAYGAGGLMYSASAGRLVRAFTPVGLARLGGLSVATGFLLLYLIPRWYLAPLAMACAGFGMYLLHSTLITRATTISETARGSAISITVSIFFLGQSIGVWSASQIVEQVGTSAIILASACLIAVTGLTFAHVLSRSLTNTAVGSKA
jgi:predicted MFS family arabinose efflux permease